jgi:hypothetical protein
MFDYRTMSDVELLAAFREILVAKRRQILWRAMECHNTDEKRNPRPGEAYEKLAILSAGSGCGPQLLEVQTQITMLDAAVTQEERRLKN